MFSPATEGLAGLKEKLSQNASGHHSVCLQSRRSHSKCSSYSFLSDIQNTLTDYQVSAEIRECSISIILPVAVDGIHYITHQLVLSNLMTRMNRLFSEVSLFPRLGQYRSSVSQGLCQQELLVKSWTTSQQILDNFEEIVELTCDLGEVLQQEKVTVLVEAVGERVMIRLSTKRS